MKYGHEVVKLYKHAKVYDKPNQKSWYIMDWGCDNPTCCPDGNLNYIGPTVYRRRNVWKAAWQDIQDQMIRMLEQ